MPMQITGSGTRMDNVTIARVTDTGHLFIAGSISSLPTVEISGGIHIGSVSANVDSIYIQSGNNITGSFYQIITTPTLVSNNPSWKFEYAISGTANGITGSRIGSIIQFIEAGSFVNVIVYVNNRISTIGSYS